MTSFTTRSIATMTHGRYLVAAPADARPSLVVVGFHGYAEGVQEQLDRLASVPGADRAVLVSVQGLHRFYRGRSSDVVASWMTSQDRESAIADNLAYVNAVLNDVTHGLNQPTVVFAGFSQGVAMAFRAACASSRLVGGVIAVGGDIPPELDDRALGRLPAVLIGRGARDTWYTPEQMAVDLERLRAAAVRADEVLLDAGHEWTAEFSHKAGAFLLSL